MPHYYDEEQKGPIEWTTIVCRTKDHELTLWSANGIFSKDRLDSGTKLLIDTMVLEDGWRVHDLGCGNGVVGITAKIEYPSCRVLCSDTSKRAVKVTRRNVRDLGLDIDVVQSDGYGKIEGAFDAILVNPPYVAGRKEVFRLLEDAHSRLNTGGLLQVVVRHQKGGKAVMAHMEGLFGDVDDSRKGGGYRVYIGRKS